jgi:NAD-reducing hydrogenase large subunit
MYAGMVNPDGGLEWYDGRLHFKDAAGETVAAGIPAHDYAEYIGEASLKNSYLKAPYFKPIGYPGGVYRVGPLARLNVAERFGTPEADRELAEFRQRCGAPAQSSFHYHYARLIELIHALEKIEILLADPAILGKHVRSHAPVNSLEGVGMIEAPRGVLIHHYKVDDKGAIQWVNLIVATGHNNLAINRSVAQVARHFIDGTQLKEGMLNRVSAVVRAYDPCLSCSTHADGTLDMEIKLIGAGGAVLDRLR